MIKLVLLALLIGAILVGLRRRSGRLVNAWSAGANTPTGGSTYGKLATYFEKISELDEGNFDGFFVSASAVGSDHIVQMSAGTDRSGQPFYEFDVPLSGWSAKYADAIAIEAQQRNGKTVRTDDADIGFLDVSFSDLVAHEDFARWVVANAFRLPETTQFEITWG